METDALTAAEDTLRAADEELTTPGERECLLCYLERMVAEFGCDNGLRWAGHWRGRNAPRATGLSRRLQAGAGYCDCEVLFNVFGHLLREEYEPLQPCAGVSRRGSTQPCLRGRDARSSAPTRLRGDDGGRTL